MKFLSSIPFLPTADCEREIGGNDTREILLAMLLKCVPGRWYP